MRPGSLAEGRLVQQRLRARVITDGWLGLVRTGIRLGRPPRQPARRHRSCAALRVRFSLAGADPLGRSSPARLSPKAAISPCRMSC